jgi:hypothetical protein
MRCALRCGGIWQTDARKSPERWLDRWSTRLMNRLLPWLVRTGLLQWLQRKQYRYLSDGVVPVRLVV